MSGTSPVRVAILMGSDSDLPVMAEAAKILEGEGIGVTVVNSRFVVPLDRDLIGSLVDRHEVMVTVEENMVAGGFGSAILELLHEKNCSAPPAHCLAIPPLFVEHGSQDLLRKMYRLDPKSIAQEVRLLLSNAKGET